MKVHVISKTGKALIPTSPARARKMLRDRKATVAYTKQTSASCKKLRLLEMSKTI